MKYIILIMFISTSSAFAKQWSLHDLLNYALENSPTIKKSQIETDISTLDIELAKQEQNFGFILDLETFTGFTFGRQSLIVGGVVISEDVTNNNDFIDPFLVLQFKYPIFKDGKFIFQKSLSEDIAETKKDNSISKLKLNKEELIYSLAILYLDLVQLSKKIYYLQDSLIRLDTILKETKARFDENIISKQELIEAEYTKNNKELELKIARIDLEVFERQFLNLLGMAPNKKNVDFIYDIVVFDQISLSIPDYKELKQRALQDSTELLIAENELELSRLKSKMLKNKLMPDIFIRDTSVFTVDDNGHWLALGISFPLHNFLKRGFGDPEVKKSILDIEKNKINVSQTEDKIEFELFKDFSNWKKSIYISETLEHNIKIEESKLQETREKFNDRYITTGEYLEQVDRFEISRIEYNNQKKNQVNSLLVLLKNSGLIEESVLKNYPANQ